ncbi:MAG TPA: glycoside hydrolase family 2 TIM barrel-domain containing protein [Bryobacteraceae bacterium]|nr:glycoside hydrolase family 2 TIM barrel-domain containing protein [Bryobacteraceae bacterium]
MRLFIATALLSMSTAFAQSPHLSPLANVASRRTISLDGKWQTIVDPYEVGYYDFHQHPGGAGFFRNQHAKNKSELVEYDFDKSPQLDVPGDWNTQRPDLLFYEGTIWYKKSFDYEPKPDTRVFLYFGAANYDAIVALNGVPLGEHVGGFTPFAFEVTGKLRDKDNFVVVKVDNKRLREGVPQVNTDWWNYGGITRDVMLVEAPSTFVQDYFLQLKRGDAGTVAGWVKLDGAKARQTVRVKIPEAGISQQVTTNDAGFAEIAFPAKFTLWSPENPKLYKVTIAAETDSVDDLIGFRSIETRGQDILLNGKSIFLRGVAIHEEAPFRSGRAFSKEDAHTLLSWAKELGCNYVRLAHYPHNENMVREADRIGLMVWSEVPVYWAIQWENPTTYANAANQILESIARDKNRAAIVLWSVANETPVNEARNTFLRNLVRVVRTEDPTRLVTAATLASHKGDEIVIEDPLGADLDVLGNNEYIGWYEGLPDRADQVTWRSIYDKPLIMSEFGAGAVYGAHGDDLTRFTEEYQESVYRHQVRMLARIPFLRGTSPWILMDFRSPRRTLPGIQDYFNRKGLISLRGEKKKAFYVMQEFYRQKAAESR